MSIAEVLERRVRWHVAQGDCLEALRAMPDASIDAIVTDPPSAIGFMGKAWDRFGAEDAAFAYYLAGLTDGEGCFRIHKQKAGAYYACHFQIKLRADDRPILEHVQLFLGLGRIVEIAATDAGGRHAKPAIMFIVDTREGCIRVRDVFRKYPLRAKKRLDFAIWSEALEGWIQQERGNRWDGPSDKSRMKAAWLKLREARGYSDPPQYTGDLFIDQLSDIFREALRVLKPGGHALVWALPRTSYRTGMALEMAGLEVRDVITHMFGSGFPKSLNIEKAIGKINPEPAAAWEGWGTALKPAAEFWFLCRKPPKGSIAKNVLEHGTGAINIDACRVAHASAEDFAAHADQVAAIKAKGGSMDNSWKNSSDLSGAADANPLGRWPAHVILSHADDCERIGVRKVKASTPWGKNDRPPLFTGDEVSPIHYGGDDGFETVEHWRCADGCPVAMLDEKSGIGATAPQGPNAGAGIWARGTKSGYPTPSYSDVGGASRYFTTLPPEPERFGYFPKASRDDREKGCEFLPKRQWSDGREKPIDNPRLRMKAERHNVHSTVKSTALMRWLVRLITPPNGIVLDMFAGSGSTGVACSAEGFRFIGIELDPAYVEIARARIIGDAPLFNMQAAL